MLDDSSWWMVSSSLQTPELLDLFYCVEQSSEWLCNVTSAQCQPSASPVPAFPGLSVFPIRSPPSAGEAEQRRGGEVERSLFWRGPTTGIQPHWGHGYLADVDAGQYHGA